MLTDDGLKKIKEHIIQLCTENVVYARQLQIIHTYEFVKHTSRIGLAATITACVDIAAVSVLLLSRELEEGQLKTNIELYGTSYKEIVENISKLMREYIEARGMDEAIVKLLDLIVRTQMKLSGRLNRKTEGFAE